MSSMGKKYSDRIGGRDFGKSTVLYKFEKIKRAKREAREKNPAVPLIDMGVGEPDMPADPGIAGVLAAEAGKPENRFYADNGIPEFQEAAARYLQKVYGVGGVNPQTEILHGIGSKPILAMLPLCFINPGDVAIVTTPGYPVMETYTRYLGGKVFHAGLRKENGFLPDLEAIPADVMKKAKMIYLNYPNNPTGRAADKEFFKRVVDFAVQHSVIVVHDASYSGIVFDGAAPLSFLSADGAKEVGVELFSLSKAFNMTGWRLAFAAGSADIIRAYAVVKDNTDSGQFRAIQKAGIYALDHPEITQKICVKYSRRFDLLTAALRDAGFDAKKPGGTFYCYVPAPRGTKSGLKFKSAEEASEFLIRECLISTVPWDDAGAFLRFSVTFEAENEDAEKKVIGDMKDRLVKAGLVF